MFSWVEGVELLLYLAQRISELVAFLEGVREGLDDSK
jgi:hypothetical protein